MKRGLAIPCGLLLFAIAVGSFLTSRPAGPIAAPTKTITAAAPIEVARNDDYVPPLLGIFDDQEMAAAGPLSELASVSFEEPRLLPLEVLRQTDWPSAQPDMLQTVGYDNPIPLPFNATPKSPSSLGQGSSTIIPDLMDTQSSTGLLGQAPTTSISSRPPENLIRPKPLMMDNPSSMARFQTAEPPLAGSPNNILVPLPTPQAPPAAPPLPPAISPPAVQPVPANIAEYTGCGCEPRVGPACGCGARIARGCGCGFMREAPSCCCQSFSSCCQPCTSCYEVVECGSCCSGGGHWRPFARLRGLFHKEQKGCCACDCFDDGGFESCGSCRKPLFSRFRSLFHKSRNDGCIYEEPCGCSGEWISGTIQ